MNWTDAMGLFKKYKDWETCIKVKLNAIFDNPVSATEFIIGIPESWLWVQGECTYIQLFGEESMAMLKSYIRPYISTSEYIQLFGEDGVVYSCDRHNIIYGEVLKRMIIENKEPISGIITTFVLD